MSLAVVGVLGLAVFLLKKVCEKYMILDSKWMTVMKSRSASSLEKLDENIDKYDEPEEKLHFPPSTDQVRSEDFEQKWQMNQITKQLKSMMEREFVGLKINLSSEFDERTVGVVKQIEGLIQVTVQKRLEMVKEELMNEIKNRK